MSTDNQFWGAPRIHGELLKLGKTIRQSDLHHGSDYTPWEGFEVTGWPVMTIARGQVVADNGRSSGPRTPAKSSVAANRA